jgi:hypothetical protein
MISGFNLKLNTLIRATCAIRVGVYGGREKPANPAVVIRIRRKRIDFHRFASDSSIMSMIVVCVLYVQY